jgi:hypothetical protein
MALPRQRECHQRPREDVRWAAVRALAEGWRDDPTTAELLREHATTSTGENVR